ncbi:hypothetical protein PY093_18770 [Cytobacillus sp. S13-E01]|uniref:hypothetical protein n=1 Tax=Cytobacillus sp. S13-E01 TaxID=3031326 RepID=UPI0023D83F88|nr:hypothetical protein [Cytobacillus sp. S13-E01]MDF0728672.1 hypothetical protein [Cytobacillus sp. S13-E01]
MVEERLERMENMISQLVQMVGNMNGRLQKIEENSEERHVQLVDQLKQLEIDQDYIWEKAARNEREIENIKRRLG